MKKLILVSILSLMLMPAIVGEKFGDVNKDGSIDIIDVVYLFKNRNLDYEVGDINCDGSINIIDVVYLFKHYDKMREPVTFAENFKLEPHWDDGYCVVIDSKDNKFVLLEANGTNPNLADATVINVPVEKLITIFYCPTVSTADILKDTSCYDTIKGTTGSVIGYSPELTNRYNEGKIVNIGKSSSINYETVLNISPDIVFLGDWSSHDTMEEQLVSNGLTVSRFYTYKEPTYLGRIEWIKFSAAFWGKDKYDETENYFQDAWKARNNILRKVHDENYYPSVALFSWSSYKDAPGVYGSAHYYNKMTNNFKGEYVFNDIPGTSFQYLDKETFYERTMDADVCIMRHYYSNEISTKEELFGNYSTANFDKFKALQNGRFYITKPKYYVYEAIDPAGYMMDYAKMLHPDLFGGDNDLKYHNKIQ